MSNHHDLIIKDLLGNRDFAVSFLQRYMTHELIGLVDREAPIFNNANLCN